MDKACWSDYSDVLVGFAHAVRSLFSFHCFSHINVLADVHILCKLYFHQQFVYLVFLETLSLLYNVLKSFVQCFDARFVVLHTQSMVFQSY